jgi:hypothetical protein
VSRPCLIPHVIAVSEHGAFAVAWSAVTRLRWLCAAGTLPLRLELHEAVAAAQGGGGESSWGRDAARLSSLRHAGPCDRSGRWWLFRRPRLTCTALPQAFTLGLHTVAHGDLKQRAQLQGALDSAIQLSAER